MPFISPSPPAPPSSEGPPPPEPPPPPRPFPLRALDAGAAFLLLFGGIWTVVGVAITIGFTIGGGPVWNDLILDRRGVRVEAMPTAIEPTGAHVNGRQVYRVSFSFLDGAGQPHDTDAETTDRALRARAERRERLSIDYDPRQPVLARLTGGSASFFGWFVLFPLAFAVAGLLILRAALARVWRTRALYVHGQAALARVTDVSPTSMRVNRRPVMRVAYEFETIMGKSTGSTTSLNPPALGARLWIFYRPSSPAESVAAR